MEGGRVELCRLEDIPCGESRGFSVAPGGEPQDIFVVRTQDGLYGYRNSCPHTGGPLDWVPGRFLSVDGRRIQCATHDALFRIEDGLCVRGPCAGRSLTGVRLETDDERLWLVTGPSGDQ